ncbi:hypothetical protein [Streptomyces sp. AP-93]|uniref:hypothetical protein n=1 Tax=Streptomyces sp. AP-93 TaxID=2929048 RepID=UPI001FAFFC01|nr:hypothetical protein [Streptomyces sp. AP-93]MCJ0868073.1 hypothetical protein [Streptomyces sp. AP-93]
MKDYQRDAIHDSVNTLISEINDITHHHIADGCWAAEPGTDEELIAAADEIADRMLTAALAVKKSTTAAKRIRRRTP